MAGNGPFSCFPGIDRTLAVLAGPGLRLSIDGKAPIVLTRRTEPFAFAGDVEADAALVHGDIVDLNVMTRRGRFSHRVNRIHVAGSAELGANGAESLLYCAEGEMRVQTPAGSAALGRADALLIPSKGAWRLQAEAHAVAFFVEFYDVSIADRR